MLQTNKKGYEWAEISLFDILAELWWCEGATKGKKLSGRESLEQGFKVKSNLKDECEGTKGFVRGQH